MQSHTIIDTASPRYGFDPKIAFATTRARAERRRASRGGCQPGQIAETRALATDPPGGTASPGSPSW